MIKFADVVIVTSPLYCCAEVGDLGKIVDDGYLTDNDIYRYCVRWDSNPTMVYGVHSDCIEKYKK